MSQSAQEPDFSLVRWCSQVGWGTQVIGTLTAFSGIYYQPGSAAIWILTAAGMVCLGCATAALGAILATLRQRSR